MKILHTTNNEKVTEFLKKEQRKRRACRIDRRDTMERSG